MPALGSGLLTQITAIVRLLSGGSVTWPKFNACKLVTQRPLVGWTDSLKVCV